MPDSADSCGGVLVIKDFCLIANSVEYARRQLVKLTNDNPGTKYRLNCVPWQDKRSNRANSQYWVWVPDISDFICEDQKTTANQLKLDFGLPLILADEKMGPKLQYILESTKFNFMTREQQVGMMEFIQVTSLMDTKQHNKMRDDIVYFYNQAGLNIGYNDE